MPIFDAILLIILAGFVFYGLFFGLIRTLGMLAGVIVGAFLASRFYLFAAAWLSPVFFGHNNLGKVLAFIIIFTIANRLTGLLFYLADRVFKIISIVPFLKTFNRLGGAILGFLSGSLIIGLLLFVIARYSFLSNWFGHWLTSSELTPFFLKINNILLPLLPMALKKLQSLI